MTKVALVVGGTGMLSGTVKSLTDNYDIVGVVARSPSKLNELASFSPKIVSVQSDYTNLEMFESSLSDFAKTCGSMPSTIVSWIHSEAPEASYALAKFCDNDYFDITGSSGRNSDHPSRVREKIIQGSGKNYHRIVLGSIGDRWLTNNEISNGVYSAIIDPKPQTIVGE